MGPSHSLCFLQRRLEKGRFPRDAESSSQEGGAPSPGTSRGTVLSGLLS